MPIAFDNGFYIAHDLAHVSCIAIESHRLEECIARVKASRMKGILGLPSHGFSGLDLNFLKELPWIEAVWFVDAKLKNIDGLYSLPGLKYFGVHQRPPIDFSRFRELRSAIIHPKSRDHGLASLEQLNLLHIWHYRPKKMDFSELEFPVSLDELQINWANISSLESLPRLPGLRRFEVHRCRNLEVLGDHGAKFPLLEHLVITACGRLPSNEGERVVRDLPKLRHAYERDRKLV